MENYGQSDGASKVGFCVIFNPKRQKRPTLSAYALKCTVCVYVAKLRRYIRSNNGKAYQND